MSTSATPFQYVEILSKFFHSEDICVAFGAAIPAVPFADVNKDFVDKLMKALYQKFKHLNNTKLKVSSNDLTKKLGGALRVGGNISITHAIKLLGFAELVHQLLGDFDIASVVNVEEYLIGVEALCGPIPDDDRFAFAKFCYVLEFLLKLSLNPKQGDSVAIAAMLSDGKAYSMGKSKTLATKRREKAFECFSGKTSLTVDVRYNSRPATIGRKRNSQSTDEESSVDTQPRTKKVAVPRKEPTVEVDFDISSVFNDGYITNTDDDITDVESDDDTQSHATSSLTDDEFDFDLSACDSLAMDDVLVDLSIY